MKEKNDDREQMATCFTEAVCITTFCGLHFVEICISFHKVYVNPQFKAWRFNMRNVLLDTKRDAKFDRKIRNSS